MVTDESLDELAKASGFKQRKSLISPKDFLETVFLEHAGGHTSLSQYCTSMYLHQGKSVSKQAMDKRFRSGAKDFLRLLVEKVMRQQLACLQANTLRDVFSEIRLADSTEFALSAVLAEAFPGYGGAGRQAMAQIQFEYELLSQKITRLSLGNALDADVSEGLRWIDTVPQKALLIKDLGYFNLSVYQQLQRRQLYFISRLQPQVNIYIEQAGQLKQLTKAAIMEMLTKSQDKYLDLDVLIGKDKKLPVRLIANLLNEEQKSRRLRRKRLNKGKKMTKEDVLNASLNLFITNVEKEKCAAQKVYELYTLRWQVELVFKTWKSILNIHQFNPMNAERFECLMYIKFIWILLNWSLVRLYSTLSETEISLHKFTHTLKRQVHQLVSSLVQADGSLGLWLQKLFKASLIYHQKEYKKGSRKIAEILTINH